MKRKRGLYVTNSGDPTFGRKAVGIEMDAHWCRQITKRLSQQAFDLGDIA